MRKSIAVLAVLCLAVSQAKATTTIVTGDLGDGNVDVNGVAVNLSDPTMRPGTGGGSAHSVVRGQAGVLFFQLPTLSPSTISSADVRLSFVEFEGSPEFNIDLVALGVRSSATIFASDYFAGPGGGSDTLIEAKFLTPSSTAGNLDASLGSYLQTLYNSGGVPLDNFLVLRLNADVFLPTPNLPIRGYTLATADNPNPGLVPELTINTVPEPSSLVLTAFGLAALAAWGCRRRRNG